MLMPNIYKRYIICRESLLDMSPYFQIYYYSICYPQSLGIITPRTLYDPLSTPIYRIYIKVSIGIYSSSNTLLFYGPKEQIISARAYNYLSLFQSMQVLFRWTRENKLNMHGTLPTQFVSRFDSIYYILYRSLNAV